MYLNILSNYCTRKFVLFSCQGPLRVHFTFFFGIKRTEKYEKLLWGLYSIQQKTDRHLFAVDLYNTKTCISQFIKD